MLFVKYVSDVWHDHYGQYKAQLGDDGERIRRRMKYEEFAARGLRFPDLYRQHKKGLMQRLLTGRARV